MLTKVTGTTQVLTVNTSVANSSIISNAVKVRLATTTDTYIHIGNTLVAATSSDFILPAGTAEHFKLPDTAVAYISCLRVSADGKLSITPVA